MPAKPKQVYFINNAGLVLITPFIVTYFTRLSLDVAFKSDSDRQKAIQALLFVATGNDTYTLPDAEAMGLIFGLEVTAIKILPPLTTEEKVIAEGLLQAMLKTWDKLNNTSINGLRTSFLQRPGKLTKDEDKVSIIVEKERMMCCCKHYRGHTE
ncbi:MAG: hypothetical protein JWP71_2285 [Mucilaginibacter sp.]|nr:contractile injection system tape measure protein [Mucilaginibacter sp.]MDB5031564.1 hypothetical protein [Mucilaginibacter sp.]